MPLYEYRCNECGEVFEIMLRFSESNQIPHCPKCANPNTHKKMSTVAAFGSTSTSGNVSSASNCGSRGGFS